MKDTRTPETLCPRCGYKMDAASGLNHDREPTPGDFSICLQCGQLLRFDDNLAPLLALDREIEELDPEQRALVRRAQAVISRIIGPDMRRRARHGRA